MDSHQRVMWNRMIELVDGFNIGTDDLGALVRDLRGLFVEADPHDPGTRSDFESYWSPIDGASRNCELSRGHRRVLRVTMTWRGP